MPKIQVLAGSVFKPGTAPKGFALKVVRKSCHFMVRNSAGTHQYGGHRYNILSDVQFDQAGEDLEVYIVEKALVVAASGAALGSVEVKTVMPDPPTTTASTVSVTGSGTVSIFPRTVTLKVCVVAPCVKDYLDPSPMARLAEFAAALAEASVGGDLDLIMAPEAYFCTWKKHAYLPKSHMVALSHEQHQAVLASLLELSKKYPKTLFIPGTIISAPAAPALTATSGAASASTATSNVSNTAVVLLNGNYVVGADGETSYRKKITETEERFQLLVASWSKGPRCAFDFGFRELSCRLEICADHKNEPVGKEFDLQLVVGLGFGAPVVGTRAGGRLILAEGEGFARVFKKGMSVALEEKRAKVNTFLVEITQLVALPDTFAAPKNVTDLISGYAMELAGKF